jgi:G:T/U-mismatch repair DNA glycosylase
MLWPVLDYLFGLKLRYDNSREAVEQRLAFLQREKTGICDIVESCCRRKLDAADITMEKLELRDIFGQLRLHPTIQQLIFTGGNSKNGPEYLFRKQCRLHGISLACLDLSLPKKHRFLIDGRIITTVSLISPSNAANRAIGATSLYKRRRQENPSYTTLDYRVEQYRAVFGSSLADSPANASNI